MEEERLHSEVAYQQHMDERKLLIDAAREAARTFDKAMLTFGSAVFGFSIAFIKEIAPQPVEGSLRWLVASWMLFSVGLLSISVSFLFSKQACDFEMAEGRKRFDDVRHESPRNKHSDRTDICNYSCVACLFLGISLWSVFALINLRHAEAMSKGQRSQASTSYVPTTLPSGLPTQPSLNAK